METRLKSKVLFQINIAAFLEQLFSADLFNVAGDVWLFNMVLMLRGSVAFLRAFNWKIMLAYKLTNLVIPRIY